jgi:CRP-like cAMP-binding protein
MPDSLSRLPDQLRRLLPAELLRLCEPQQYDRGARLFVAGRKPEYMFYVMQGEVVLERTGQHGESVILQRARQGFAGEASLQSERYHCDARGLAPADLVRRPGRAWRAALESDPLFAGRWIGMLNREVRRLRLQCERLSLHRVQDRLVHLLETEGSEGRLPLEAGLKSIAAEIGVSHEALYRCVAGMEKQGVLRREAGSLCLTDKPTSTAL